MVKLSICIPTYNRADFLDCALKALVNQILEHRFEAMVQVCVSDNGSLDYTETVVQSYCDTHPFIAYKKFATHQGFSSNLYQNVRMAAGQFVTFSGDDDVILPGAIKTILKAIDLGHDVVLFNSLPGRKNIQASLAKERIEYIENSLMANERFGIFHASFIGNIMIRRETFLQLFTDSLFDSAYPHLGIVHRALQVSRGVFVDKALYKIDDSQRQWQSLQPYYTAIDLARLYTEEEFYQKVPQKVIYKTYSQLVRSIPRAIFCRRSGFTPPSWNSYNSVKISNIIECYRRSMFFQFIAAALWAISWLLPRSVLAVFLKKNR